MHTSFYTGLPNLRAMNEMDIHCGRALAVAVSVIDWLEFRGSEREALANAKADVLREAHLDVYHDEHTFSRFLYRGDSVEKLRAKLEDAREMLRNRRVEVSSYYDGYPHIVAGVDFSYGIGKDMSEAEAAERLNRSR